MLIKCIQSVRLFHKDSFIYLINDSNENYISKIINQVNKFNNIKIVETKVKGSADQQVFKLILEIENTSSHFIIIQDSMFLNAQLDNIDKIKDIKFLWHFTNHRIDWDKIHEPQTEFNIKNNINTHTDLIKYNLINNYFEDDFFLKYALYALDNKNIWCGCFGNCCIITKEYIKFLNEKSNFCEKFTYNNTNRERRMNESIFALLCHYYLPKNYEDSYDGIYYDGINSNPFNSKPTGFYDLTYCCKNKYVSKISFDR
jgi:hypothetical protein